MDLRDSNIPKASVVEHDTHLTAGTAHTCTPARNLQEEESTQAICVASL